MNAVVALEPLEPGFNQKMIRLALPICVQMVLFNMLSLVDVLMLGAFGEAQVAAAGLAARIMFVTVIVLVGVAAGATVLGAQYFGAKNDEGLKSVYGMAIAIGFLLMLPVAVGFLLWPQAMAMIASTDPQVLAYTGSYLMIMGPTVLLSAVVIPFESAMRTIHATQAPTWISAAAIVTNVIFNWLLIFGNLGMPRLEIVGAAWASVIGRSVHILLCFWVVYRFYPSIALRIRHLLEIFNWQQLRRFAKLSVPLIINESLWVLGIFAYGVIYGRMGTAQLATVNMLTPIEGVLISIFVGLAIATSILVGNELGAGRFGRARAIARYLLWVLPLAAVVSGFGIALAHPLLSVVYPGVGAETLQMAENLLILLGLIMWSKVLNMVLILGVLRAGGDNNFVLYAEVVSMWGVGVPLAAVMAFVLGWPLYWVFLATFVEEVVKAALGFWRYRSGKWIKNLVH